MEEKEFSLSDILKLVFIHFEGWAIIYYFTWIVRGEIPETLVQLTLGACALEVFLTAAIKIADKIKQWKKGGAKEDDDLELASELLNDIEGGNG